MREIKYQICTGKRIRRIDNGVYNAALVLWYGWVRRTMVRLVLDQLAFGEFDHGQ